MHVMSTTTCYIRCRIHGVKWKGPATSYSSHVRSKIRSKWQSKGTSEKAKTPFCVPTTISGAWDLYSHSHDHPQIIQQLWCDRVHNTFKLDPPKQRPIFLIMLDAGAPQTISTEGSQKGEGVYFFNKKKVKSIFYFFTI